MSDPKHGVFKVNANKVFFFCDALAETVEYIKTLEAEHGEVATISKGSSLKLCMVAEGQADCYPRFAPTMEWDTAAGSAICKYAGKTVLDWETKEEMRYNREQLLNNWFLVK